MLTRGAYRRIDSSGHTSSRGTNQRFPHCSGGSFPTGGIWINCHVPSANGSAGFQYPIAHTGANQADIRHNGDARCNHRHHCFTVPTG